MFEHYHSRWCEWVLSYPILSALSKNYPSPHISKTHIDVSIIRWNKISKNSIFTLFTSCVLINRCCKNRHLRMRSLSFMRSLHWIFHFELSNICYEIASSRYDLPLPDTWCRSYDMSSDLVSVICREIYQLHFHWPGRQLCLCFSNEFHLIICPQWIHSILPYDLASSTEIARPMIFHLIRVISCVISCVISDSIDN